MKVNLSLFNFLRAYGKIHQKAKYSSNSQCYNKKQIENEVDNEVRFNEINLQMLPSSLYKQIFGDAGNHESYNEEEISLIKDEFKKFGILTGNNESLIPHVNINIPSLKGHNIEDHFNQIALEQSQPYLNLIKNFQELPPMPESFILQEGWVRYLDSGYEMVEYPPEKELIFDVETCVKNGPLPVLATAVSSTSWYSWVSKQLIQGNCSSFANKTVTPDLLIPLESGKTDEGFSLTQFQLMPKIVIGHNVSFDRARIKEQYWINETGTKFLDTMSLHVCVSGPSSYQRSLLKSKNNDNAKEKELHNFSSLNNLADVYKLYCGKDLDKSGRDIFVDGELLEIKKQFHQSVKYCALDVVATYNVLKKIFPMFLERFPHPATLAGMLELNSVYLPVNYNWKRYLKESETVYKDLSLESKICLSRRADQVCRLLMENQFKKDSWMWDQDWAIKDFKLKKQHEKLNANKKNQGKTIKKKRTLDEKFEYFNVLKEYIPKKVPHLPGYPNWYRKLYHLEPKTINLAPITLNISTSMLVSPKLLSLTWKEHPLHHIRQYGWGFLVPKNDDDSFTEPTGPLGNTKICEYNENNEVASLTITYENGSQKYSKSYNFFKLPHKDGILLNVGNPLAKDFMNKFSENILKGIDADSSKILEVAKMSSYWKNNRDRILSQFVVWLENRHSINLKSHKKVANVGAVIPQVVAAGTLTRRAVEPTWMTASNAQFDRIGSELRAMVNAPPNYNIVGADVDSQELWIASIIGDASYKNLKIHGATPLSWMTLIGNKSMGTDMHSVTAKAIGISRDQAKVINYARIYGAGQKFAQRLLKQFNPSMTDEDALKKSKKMFLMTKGKKIYHAKSDLVPKTDDNQVYSASEAFRIAKLQNKSVNNLFERAKWFGGTESAMFNSLEEIAHQASPKTPFLNAKLSRALEKQVDEKNLPTKINWVVQSSAVDFLHLILVCMRWLMKDKARLCLSFHDEVRYLVPCKYRYNAALSLHLTNLFVRSYFVSKLGMKDLPMSVAFFNSVEVDTVLRKEANQDYVTPSNPHGLKEGYGINYGESLNVWAAIEKSNGVVGVCSSSNKKNE